MDSDALATVVDEVKGIGPGAKYLLVRLVQQYGLRPSSYESLKETAKSFGIAEKQISKALVELQAAKVLLLTTSPIGRGRPRNVYTLAPKYIDRLKKKGITKLRYGSAIGCFLQQGDLQKNVAPAPVPIKESKSESLARVRASKFLGKLDVISRLVMAVLLSRADKFGVVCDLGSAELSRLTGLNNERLKNRVKMLLKVGLLRAYVPGATGELIFKKIKSIYVINLDKFVLSSEQVYPVLLSSFKRAPGSEDMDDITDIIFNPKVDVVAKFHYEVWKFLQAKHERNLKNLLRNRLEVYAGFLLSCHWDRILDGKKSPALHQLIKQDLIYKSSANEDEFPSEKHYEQLVEYLIDQAAHIAIVIKYSWYEGNKQIISGIDFQSMEYVLLPAKKAKHEFLGEFYQSQAMLALPKEGVTSSKGIYLVEWLPNGTVKGYEHRQVGKVPIEELYLYGFLALPEGKLVIDAHGQIVLPKV